MLMEVTPNRDVRTSLPPSPEEPFLARRTLRALDALGPELVARLVAGEWSPRPRRRPGRSSRRGGRRPAVPPRAGVQRPLPRGRALRLHLPLGRARGPSAGQGGAPPNPDYSSGYG